jgi:hypothetical protein
LIRTTPAIGAAGRRPFDDLRQRVVVARKAPLELLVVGRFERDAFGGAAARNRQRDAF